MIYLNQLEYPDMKYNHNMDEGGAPEGKDNVKAAGCGLCSLCMVVDQLTTKHLELADCVRLSEEKGANRKMGTNLRVLGLVVAEMYGLRYSNTNDPEEVKTCLQKGGRVVANVGGDREGYIGLFSHIGHYIVLVSIDGSEVCILDPSRKEGKFDEEGREGKVRLGDPFVYCDMAHLVQDCANRDPGFHLFTRA